MKKRNRLIAIIALVVVVLGAAYFVYQKMSADEVSGTKPFVVTVTPDKLTAVDGDIVTYKITYKNTVDTASATSAATTSANRRPQAQQANRMKMFQLSVTLPDGTDTGKSVTWSVNQPVYNQVNEMSVPVTIQYPKDNVGKTRAYGADKSTTASSTAIKLNTTVVVGQLQNRYLPVRQRQATATPDCSITISPKPAAASVTVTQ